MKTSVGESPTWEKFIEFYQQVRDLSDLRLPFLSKIAHALSCMRERIMFRFKCHKSKLLLPGPGHPPHPPPGRSRPRSGRRPHPPRRRHRRRRRGRRRRRRTTPRLTAPRPPRQRLQNPPRTLPTTTRPRRQKSQTRRGSKSNVRDSFVIN